MMQVGYGLLKDLVALTRGRLRLPRFQSLTGTRTNIPSGPNEGIDTAEASTGSAGVVCGIYGLRPVEFSVVIRVDLGVAGTQYGVSFRTLDDASNATIITASDEASVVIGEIKDEIEAEWSLAGISIAGIDQLDPATILVRLSAPCSVWHGVIGSGTMRVVADATYAAYQVWGLDFTGRWHRIGDPRIASLVTESDELDLSNWQRVFVQVLASNGWVVPFVMTSEIETRTALIQASQADLEAKLSPEGIIASMPAFTPESTGHLSGRQSVGVGGQSPLMESIRGLLLAASGFKHTHDEIWPNTDEALEACLSYIPRETADSLAVLDRLKTVAEAYFSGHPDELDRVYEALGTAVQRLAVRALGSDREDAADRIVAFLMTRL